MLRVMKLKQTMRRFEDLLATNNSSRLSGGVLVRSSLRKFAHRLSVESVIKRVRHYSLKLFRTLSVCFVRCCFPRRRYFILSLFQFIGFYILCCHWSGVDTDKNKKFKVPRFYGCIEQVVVVAPSNLAPRSVVLHGFDDLSLVDDSSGFQVLNCAIFVER